MKRQTEKSSKKSSTSEPEEREQKRQRENERMESENTGGASKMKFIDIREGWIRQVRDHNQIQFAKIEGTANPADTSAKLLDRRRCDVYQDELMCTNVDQLRGVRE